MITCFADGMPLGGGNVDHDQFARILSSSHLFAERT